MTSERFATRFALTALLLGWNTAAGLLLALLAVTAAQAAPPIVIALVSPATGRFAVHAEADRRGTEMAIDEFNSRGGVLGREIVLISRDPSLDSKAAAQVATELYSGPSI